MSLTSFSTTHLHRVGIHRDGRPYVRRKPGRHKIVRDEIPRIYYTTKEVADKIGVAPSCIRFWDTEFSLDFKQNRRGKRMITCADIEKLREIYRLLKVEGYTLIGAKKRLRNG